LRAFYTFLGANIAVLCAYVAFLSADVAVLVAYVPVLSAYVPFLCTYVAVLTAYDAVLCAEDAFLSEINTNKPAYWRVYLNCCVLFAAKLSELKDRGWQQRQF